MSVFTNPASSSKKEARAHTEALLSLIGTEDPLDVLRRTPAAAERAVEGMSAPQMSMPEAEGEWSVRRVLRHLVDSEIVWSWRLRLVLAQERPQLTGFDQDAWAGRLGYADADPEESPREFDVLRRGNLRLLEGASPEDLKRIGIQPERGEESVAHMIRLYAGHDLLHLRQLDRIRAAVSLADRGRGIARTPTAPCNPAASRSCGPFNLGERTVTMDRLRSVFEGLRLANVATFIASGNVVFDSEGTDAVGLEARIERELRRALAFDVTTFVRVQDELVAVARHRPFDEAGHAAESGWYVGFAPRVADRGRLRKVEALRSATDALHVHGREIYWPPVGLFSDSPISGAVLEKALTRRAPTRQARN